MQYVRCQPGARWPYLAAALVLVASVGLGPARSGAARDGVRSTLGTARDPLAYAQALRTPSVNGHVPLTRREAVVEQMLAHAHTLAPAQAAATAQRLCDEAEREGFDPLLFVAQIGVESGFRHLALSHVGAEGLMQLMPGTAEFLAARGRLDWSDNHTFDPVLNVTLGVRYMAELRRMFHGHMDQALTAYNRGPAATRDCLRGRQALPAGVRAAYAERVLAQYRNLHRHYAGLPRA